MYSALMFGALLMLIQVYTMLLTPVWMIGVGGFVVVAAAHAIMTALLSCFQEH